eukprot:2146258-Rhodomonas_salina.2
MGTVPVQTAMILGPCYAMPGARCPVRCYQGKAGKYDNVREWVSELNAWGAAEVQAYEKGPAPGVPGPKVLRLPYQMSGADLGRGYLPGQVE